MKASLVKLKNILGIEELEFRLRDRGVTVLAGGNGKGKTSVLSALAGVVKGGHDATLLRRGTEEGEIVLELDDGTVLTEKVGLDASKLTAKTAKGRITAVKKWLDSVVQRETFDLVGFLRAPAVDRIKLLLHALPIELPAEVKAVAESTGILLPQDVHPLEILARLEKGIYDQRTGLNRSAKDKRSTAGELRAAALSEEWDPAGLEAEAKALLEERQRVDHAQMAEIEAAVAEEKEKTASVLTKAKEITEEINLEFDRQLADVNGVFARRLEEIDAQIASLREQRASVVTNQEAAGGQNAKDRGAALLDLERQRDGRIEKVAAARKDRVNTAKANWARDAKDAADRAAAVVEKNRMAEKAAATRQIVERTEREAGELEAQAGKLTSALERLAKIREELANDLPIKGLSVVDGEIHMHGVPFGRLSGSERVGLAFEIARACLEGAPEGLRFVIVDGAECLDPEHFAALEQAAASADVQVLCTRVDDGALRVEGA